MSNEDNNFKELAIDADATAELDMAALRQGHLNPAEVTEKTFDMARNSSEDDSAGLSVSELASRLQARDKTINHLQYDITQVNSKSLALVAELAARESQTTQLHEQLLVAQTDSKRDADLLQNKTQEISALKTEIQQRDDERRRLKVRQEELRLRSEDLPVAAQDAEYSAEGPQQQDLQRRLVRTERYADSLRQQSQDLIEFNASAQRSIKSLSDRLEDSQDSKSKLVQDLAIANTTIETLRAGSNSIQAHQAEPNRLPAPSALPNEKGLIDSETQIGASKVDRTTRVLVGKVGDQVLRFPLFKDRLTIGRTTDNDIQLEAGYVSRRHAIVQTDDGMTRIIDWGSKNGIQVNGKKVSEHVLNDGDTIVVGNAHFRYEERRKRDG